MITIDKDYIILSSGKRVYAHCAIVGLCLVKSDRSDNLEVFGGYDQSISWPIPDWWSPDEKVANASYFLTDDEMKELAIYMSERWEQLSESIGPKKD